MAFAPLGEGEKLRDRFSAQGVDRIEMMFCANLGQALKPLARVASGGELSRIMLALKNLSAQKPGIPEAWSLTKSTPESAGAWRRLWPRR